jgi:hypothetical protein
MGTNNFIIEKSYDGINYSRIATKTATGPLNTPTSYYYNDNVQNAGVNTTIYYRIKAMDTNGRYAYSNVVIIRLGKTATVQAWPVPFSDYVNISYTAISNSFIRVTLTNAVGKLVRQTTFNVNRGLNQLALNDLQSVSPGLYFLRITDLSTNQVYTRNISK